MFQLPIPFNLNYIKYGILFVVIISTYIYINSLKSDIEVKDQTITNMHNTYVRDQLIWSINEKTLELTITDQNNKIKQFEINEKAGHIYFNNSLDTLKKEYWVKISEAKDSNKSQEIEYQAFKKFVREEIK